MKYLIPFVSSLLLFNGCSVKTSVSAKIETSKEDLSIGKIIGRTDRNGIGIYLWVDPETNCEYLSIYETPLVPRLDNTGKQICR